MSERSDPLLLDDIRIAVDRIRSATRGLSFEAFDSDVVVQDAVIRNFEVIGEASKRISAELKARHPSIDWRGMVGFRNFLIHVYFGVDLSTVWQIIQDDLPVLGTQLKGIFA